MAGRIPANILRADVIDGGRHRITGTVDELGAPGKYRVRLFDRYSARCIRETWSDESGAYAFDWIAYRYQGYFAVAYDHGDLPLNAAIRDRVTPIPMGESVPAYNLPLLEGQTFSGLAMGVDGHPAELISIRDWESKKTLANVVPDQTTGAWTVTLPNGTYDVTYFKDGCAPICHGPYTVDAG